MSSVWSALWQAVGAIINQFLSARHKPRSGDWSRTAWREDCIRWYAHACSSDLRLANWRAHGSRLPWCPLVTLPGCHPAAVVATDYDFVCVWSL